MLELGTPCSEYLLTITSIHLALLLKKTSISILMRPRTGSIFKSGFILSTSTASSLISKLIVVLKYWCLISCTKQVQRRSFYVCS